MPARAVIRVSSVTAADGYGSTSRAKPRRMAITCYRYAELNSNEFFGSNTFVPRLTVVMIRGEKRLWIGWWAISSLCILLHRAMRRPHTTIWWAISSLCILLHQGLVCSCRLGDAAQAEIVPATVCAAKVDSCRHLYRTCGKRLSQHVVQRYPT